MDLILWTWSSYSNWPNAPKFIVWNGPFLISIFYLFVVFCLFVSHKLLISPSSFLSTWLSYSNWPNAPKCNVGKLTFFLLNIFRVEVRTSNAFRKMVMFQIKKSVSFLSLTEFVLSITATGAQFNPTYVLVFGTFLKTWFSTTCCFFLFQKLLLSYFIFLVCCVWNASACVWMET